MLLNFTFQDGSPLINFSPGWLEGGDQSGDNYTGLGFYDGTFRPTPKAGAFATINFVGSSIALFGALRDNHGNYTVVLDQDAPVTSSGFSAINLFRQTLFSSPSGLAYAPHGVTITNMPVSSNLNWLDIDFVTIERQIGQPSDPAFELTLDDTSPFSITYTPSGAWSPIPTQNAFQQTLHQTTVAQAQVTVSFQGCCIELYGHYTNANYTAVLDSKPPVSYHGLNFDLPSQFQHPQTLLYLMDGLSEGSHNVTLINSDSNTQRPFYFDYAVVRSTKDFSSTSSPTSNATAAVTGNPTGTTTTLASATNVAAASSASVPTAAIVGGSVGGVVVLVLLSLAVFLVIRRRRRRSTNEPKPTIIHEHTPRPYVVPNEGSRGGDGPESARLLSDQSDSRRDFADSGPIRKAGLSSHSFSNSQAGPSSHSYSNSQGGSSSSQLDISRTVQTMRGVETGVTIDETNAIHASSSSSQMDISRRVQTIREENNAGVTTDPFNSSQDGNSSSQVDTSRSGQLIVENDAGVIIDDSMLPTTLPPPYATTI